MGHLLSIVLQVNITSAPPAPAAASRLTALLDAAIGVFARFGYRKTSMDDVARAAGVSRQGLYLSFANKEELFRRALDHSLRSQLTAAITALSRSDLGLEGRVIAACEAWSGRFIGALGADAADLMCASTALAGEALAEYEWQFEQALAAAIAASPMARRCAAANLEIPDLTRALHANRQRPQTRLQDPRRIPESDDGRGAHDLRAVQIHAGRLRGLTMAKFQFGRHTTADQVLAGIDLTGKHMVVTGCNSGLGLETMNALAANGAAVIGLARSIENASQACAAASPYCIPVACDLTNFKSIAAALGTIRDLSIPLDAIVANAGAKNLPLDTRYGVEMHFLTNHLGHFMLINGLVDRLRDHSGRVVLVSGAAAAQAAVEGIMLDNLDGHRLYQPAAFYAQSKLANALYAKELSRRLRGRGICVNSADPGAARTRLDQGWRARLFARTPARAAATQALLAASPRAEGITGEYWADCNVQRGNALLEDAVLAKRLWDVSQEILERQRSLGGQPLQQAA